MKRIICLLLAMVCVLGMNSPACAQTYELECGPNGYFVCEDFEGEMTPHAAQIFGGMMREGDEVLCGTLFQEHYRNSPGKVNRGGALMAVRREGKILLMSANGDGEAWNAGIETDSFLPPDAQFLITTVFSSHYAHPTITYQDTAYEIRTLSNGGAYLYEYSWTDEKGRPLRMTCYHGEFTLYEERSEKNLCLAEGKAIPSRLAAWEADSLPKDETELLAYERENPLEFGMDEGFISGVNLRERATGESPTWGIYSAKVKTLGEKPGKTAPWVNVRVGNVDGWVSGDYLHSRKNDDGMHIYSTAVMIHAVGRAKKETALLHMPGSEAVMQLSADTYVHVLGERNGYLHVIVPRSEMNWKTDWDGIYGFVKAEDMVVGISKADAVWK